MNINFKFGFKVEINDQRIEEPIQELGLVC